MCGIPRKCGFIDPRKVSRSTGASLWTNGIRGSSTKASFAISHSNERVVDEYNDCRQSMYDNTNHRKLQAVGILIRGMYFFQRIICIYLFIAGYGSKR